MPVVRYTSCPHIPPITLRLKRPYMSSPYVKLLQQDLNKLGDHLAVDGVYGPKTRTAVVALERRYVGSEVPGGKVIVTGIVGPRTWCLVLNLAAGNKGTAVRTTPAAKTSPPSGGSGSKGASYVAPSIPVQVLPEMVLGKKFSYTWRVLHGHAPFKWYLAAGTLPAGIALSAAGVMSGTPTVVGASKVTVAVQDAHARTAQRSVDLKVVAPTSPGILQEIESLPQRLAKTMNISETDLFLGAGALAAIPVVVRLRRAATPKRRAR